MNINLNKNRIESFDIAKGIGILLMVMGHANFGFYFDKLINTFHMPLFFFVSGYFFRPEKTNGFKQYLFHQFYVLLVPYIIFAIFYEILHYIYVGEASIRYFIISFFSSNHNRIDVAGALWFLMSLFTAKIVYFILIKHTKNILLLSVVIIITSFSAFTFRKFGIILPFCGDTALSMLLIVHLGYLSYYFHDKNIINRISSLSPIVLIALIILFFVSGIINDNVLVRRNRYGIEVLYLISCFCGIVLTMNISNIFSRTRLKIISYIKNVFSYWGRESIVFLLLNELFLFIVSELIIILGVDRNLLTENYWLKCVFVLITMGLISIIAIFSKNTFLSFIFGKKRFK